MEHRDFDFLATFREAYLNLLENKNDWIKIAGGPWLIVLVVAIIGFFFNMDNIPAGKIPMSTIIVRIITSLAAFAATIMFIVRALRYRLLGEVPSTLVSFEWNRRHWKIIGYTILIGAALSLPISLLLSYTGAFLATVSLVVIIYLIGRIVLFGPVVATDVGSAFKVSWSLTAGWNWLKVLALGVAVFIPIAIGLHIVGWLLGAIVHESIYRLFSLLFANFVIIAAALSGMASCYKQLSSD